MVAAINGFRSFQIINIRSHQFSNMPVVQTSQFSLNHQRYMQNIFRHVSGVVLLRRLLSFLQRLSLNIVQNPVEQSLGLVW